MKDPISRFLTDEERTTIEERIGLAEKRTAGEIVVMVVPSSDKYPLASLLPALAGALLLAVPAAWFWGESSMWSFLGLFTLSFVVLSELVRRIEPLRRRFAGRAAMQEAVEEEAFAAFFRQGVHRTVGQTGILLYISMFEHQVRVMADEGIDRKVGHDAWQEIVDGIVGGIRSGRRGEAIASAVDRCGQLLALHFPIRPDDRNELDNRIRY